MTWHFRVQSIEFDKDFPASTFWPDLRPGVHVLDTISNKRYEVPGAPARPPAVEPQATKTSQSQSVEAIPPSDWSWVISVVSFVLGAASLVAGGVLWLRRR